MLIKRLISKVNEIEKKGKEKDINVISKRTNDFINNYIIIEIEKNKFFKDTKGRGSGNGCSVDFFGDPWNFENLISERLHKKYKILEKKILKWKLKEGTCRSKVQDFEEIIGYSYNRFENLVKEYYKNFDKLEKKIYIKDIQNELKNLEKTINNNEYNEYIIDCIKNWSKEKMGVEKYEKKKNIYIEQWKNYDKKKTNEELIYLKECYEKIYILFLQGNITEELYNNKNILLLKNSEFNDWYFYDIEYRLYDKWKEEGIKTLLNVEKNWEFLDKVGNEFLKWKFEGYSRKKYYGKAIEFWERNKFPELFKENKKREFRKDNSNLTIYGSFLKFYTNNYYKSLDIRIKEYSKKNGIEIKYPIRISEDNKKIILQIKR